MQKTPTIHQKGNQSYRTNDKLIDISQYIQEAAY